MKTFFYIFIAWGVSYLIRVLPLTLIRKPIKNRFIKSFLHYVPYVTLSVMTFPSIMNDTKSQISGIIAFAVGIVLSYMNLGLFAVAISCCAVVGIAEFFV